MNLRAYAYNSINGWIPFAAESRPKAGAMLVDLGVADRFFELPRIRRLPFADTIAAAETHPGWIVVPDALWAANGYAPPVEATHD